MSVVELGRRLTVKVTPKVSDWRIRSQEAIRRAVAEARRRCLEGREIERFVRKEGYPFGTRENWPYKIWCSELRREFRDEKPKVPTRQVKPVPGQLSLFG